MNSPFTSFTKQQAYELKTILDRIQTQTKSTYQNFQKSLYPCRNCRMDTLWNQLNNQFRQLQKTTNSFSNHSPNFNLEDLKIFYQNGNMSLSKIQSIATQMLIQFSGKRNSTSIVRSAASEAEPIINTILKELETIIFEFTTICRSFVEKNLKTTINPPTNNLNNSFSKKQDEKKFEALIAEREQNLKKIHKERQNKIRDEEAKQRELIAQQALNYENEVKTNAQRIKTLEDIVLRQRNQEQNFNEERRRMQQMSQQQRQQNAELRRLLQLQQQKRQKLQEEKRFKMQEQQQIIIKKYQQQQRQLKPLQQKINFTRKQQLKLQQQSKRLIQTVQLSKKQDYRYKQSIEVKTYELKQKMEDLEKLSGEVMKVNKFIEGVVSQRLIGVIEDLGKVNGGEKKINLDKINNSGIRKQNQLLINTQPTRDLQQNILHQLTYVQALSVHLKQQFIQLNTKLSTTNKELISLQQKISLSTNTVTIQKKECLNKQKQLKELQTKHQIFTSYESFLKAKQQQERKYEQINHKIQEIQQVNKTQLQKIQTLKSQYNIFLKERFNHACNIQELHSRIQQLTKEKNSISQMIQKKYHHQISLQTDQKQFEVQRLTELLQKKQIQLTQFINEDKKNKGQILKLTKQLQEIKIRSAKETEHMQDKLNQYEFKVNRLLEEKQQFLLKLNLASINSEKIQEVQQNSFKQPMNQLFKPVQNQQQTSNRQKFINFPTHIKISCATSKQQPIQHQIPQQKLPTFMQQKQSLQEKIFNLNKSQIQIQSQIQDINRQICSSNERFTQNQKQKIEELEGRYEENQKMIKFYQQNAYNKESQILKLNKPFRSFS